MAVASELYQQVLSRLEGGGKTLEADLADIEAGKRSAIAGGMQNLISGGLGGTTVMGAVPLAAEKTAGRARLRARGGAESKYTAALMSFANLSEASRQAELNRQATRQNVLTGVQAGRRSTLLNYELSQPPAPGTAASPYDVFGRYKEGRGPSGAGGAGGGYAQQFPSLYGDTGGGAFPSAPNLMGDTDGWTPPREYDPSMVGKSMWAQQGSQVPTTLEQGTQQAVTAGLPQSAQGGSDNVLASVTAAYRAKVEKANPGADLSHITESYVQKLKGRSGTVDQLFGSYA